MHVKCDPRHNHYWCSIPTLTHILKCFTNPILLRHSNGCPWNQRETLSSLFRHKSFDVHVLFKENIVLNLLYSCVVFKENIEWY
jgi:hypothetical protein